MAAFVPLKAAGAPVQAYDMVNVNFLARTQKGRKIIAEGKVMVRKRRRGDNSYMSRRVSERGRNGVQNYLKGAHRAKDS